jgi:hypothetical protein
LGCEAVTAKVRREESGEEKRGGDEYGAGAVDIVARYGV